MAKEDTVKLRRVTVTNKGPGDRIVYGHGHRAVTVAGGKSASVVMEEGAVARMQNRRGQLEYEVGDSVDEKDIVRLSRRRRDAVQANALPKGETSAGPVSSGPAKAKFETVPENEGGEQPSSQQSSRQLSGEELLAYSEDKSNYDHNYFMRQARQYIGDDEWPGGNVKKDRALRLIKARIKEENK